MLSERRRLVLSALVEEYIQSAQPVASKCLVDRYKVGWSSATVRNDLAHLEEYGYVYQPHVSAGRIPTESGYRAFVDDLGVDGDAGQLTPAEAAAVHQCYFVIERHISDLMRETSVLLSQLTSYAAVVLAPVVERSRIERIDLVRLAARRVLVVVITDTGRVVDRQAELASEVSQDALRQIEASLNEAFDGKLAEEVGAGADLASAADPDLLVAMTREVGECLGEADAESVYRGGTAALLGQPEFAESRAVRPLLTLLEDGFALLQVLSDALVAKDVVVRIGHEIGADELGHVSLVATNYSTESGEGIVGLIGPTRMDYSRAIGAVRCVADSLTEVLG